MITALYFKCSDGSRFKLELNYDDYAPHFGVITAHDAEHEDNDTPISFRRFDVQGRHSWRGKYIALAKVLKDCRIYDRGIDHVQVICRIGSLEISAIKSKVLAAIMAAIQGYFNIMEIKIMEKLYIHFDNLGWEYCIDFISDTVSEQEETAAQAIADIAQHPYNPVTFSYHDDGHFGGKDTDTSDTLSGRDAIGYIISFFNDDLKPEVMRLAAEETATYEAENWLKGTMYYPAPEEEED